MRWLRSPLPTCSRRRGGGFRVRLGALRLEQRGLQPLHRLVAVGVLRTLGLVLHHDAAGQVGDADRRLGLVDVLAAGAGGTEGVDLQVGGLISISSTAS
jgi:hypothetical protein